MDLSCPLCFPNHIGYFGGSLSDCDPIPGDLPNAGIELTSLASPELADGFFTNCVTWEAIYQTQHLNQVMYNHYVFIQMY